MRSRFLLITPLLAALLLTTSSFAQVPTAPMSGEAKAQVKKEAEARKQAAKLAEKQRKEEEKAAKDAAKKRPSKRNDDIENIGNRDINKGPGLRVLTPDLEAEIALGRQLSRDLESQVTLVHDPIITEYVNRVGQNLVKNSDWKIPFRFSVIDSDEVNAFSLPGGNLYINTGLIRAADDEAELAGVMAHEIAHVTARHAVEQIGRGNAIDLLSIPLSIFGGGLLGGVIQQGASFLIPVGFLAFDRKAEEEADWLGLQYMYAAGYDPGATVSFFEKLQARESAKKKMSSLFSTHPQTASRVTKTKDNIVNFLPPRERYLMTTSEFDAVKALLDQMEYERTASGKASAPTMRQRPKGDEDNSRPEDREPDKDAPPVLKRPQDRQLIDRAVRNSLASVWLPALV